MDGQTPMPKDSPETPGWGQDPVRELPRNIEAEIGILGAIFMDNGLIEEAQGVGLKPEMFTLTAHARIFQAVTKLIGRGQVADPTTLGPYFEADDSLADIGGLQYLMKIASYGLRQAEVEGYAAVIVDMHRKRGVIAVATNALQRAYGDDIDDTADGIVAAIQSDLDSVLDDTPSKSEPRSVGVGIGATLDEIERARVDGVPLGLSTGFYDIDNILGGLFRAELILLAARPSMGKTGLGLTIARNVAKLHAETGGEQGGRALFCSVEMSEQATHHRLIAMEAMVGVEKMRRPHELLDSDIERMRRAEKAVADWPLLIDSDSSLSAASLRAKARKLKRKGGLDLIVIDYLQKMQMSNRYSGNRTNEVGELSGAIKDIAIDLDVPVLALSQLSRKVEERDDKRPQLADLRDSGAIEQDADVVMFLYRDEYYLDKAKPVRRAEETDETFGLRFDRWSDRLEQAKGRAEVTVAKNRQGKTGHADLMFAGWLTEFRNAGRE